MKIYHDIIQGSEEWYQLRLGRVTASNFSKALAGGTGATRKDYMLDLIVELDRNEAAERIVTQAMQWGTDTEAEAREYYEQLNGVAVDQVGFVERDEFVGASPDGLIGDKGMIEIKCPNSRTQVKYKRAGKLPSTYKAQVQGLLWVCEREWIEFVSFDPRLTQYKYFRKRIYRDEDYIKELHTKIVMFVTEMQSIIAKDACPF